MSDTNEYEERNRASKVYALTKTCEARGWTPSDVEKFNDDDWAALAYVSKKPAPSDRTKAIVLHVLRERADG